MIFKVRTFVGKMSPFSASKTGFGIFCKGPLKRFLAFLLCFLLSLSSLKKEEMEIQFVHSPSTFRNEDVFGWATNFLMDYQEARSLLNPPSCPLNSCEISLWSAPLEGVYKINNGAAIQESSHQVGCGIIVRNSRG